MYRQKPESVGQLSRSSTEKWVRRLNIFDGIIKLCQYLTNTFIFWCIVAVFTMIEPILCSQYPTDLIWRIQVGVLFISTILFLIQIIGVATTEWEKIIGLQNEQSGIVQSITIKDMPLLKLLLSCYDDSDPYLQAV